jgi:TetR/AcrR family transcriptional regulator, transcriptional repressor for nem operon
MRPERPVRRSREAAARTRRTAVQAASRLFRERGIEAVSVGEVMATLGMTAGGFYRHFDSKEALATEACAEAFAGSALSQDSPDAMLRRYLSPAHRDAPGSGCPLPALASDMRRQSTAVRRAFTKGVRATLARVEQVAPAADAGTRRALLASMVGALAIARAVDDDELSAAMLRDTRDFWTRTLAKAPREPRS